MEKVKQKYNLKKNEDEEELQYIARVYKNKNDLNYTNKEIAEIINSELGTSYGESTLRGKATYYNEGYNCGYDEALSKCKGELTEVETVTDYGYEQIKSYKDTIEINKDNSITSDRLIGIEDESVLKDEEYLLKCHGYDSKIWTIVSARSSKWNIQKRGGDIGKLYASRVTVKLRDKDISNKEIEEFYNKLLDNYKGYNYTSEEYKPCGDNILVLPVYDLHYGKKSYKFETGSDIDHIEIEKRYMNTLNDIINQCKHLNIEKVIYPLGSDFFNSDTIDSTTTRGTKQDDSLRWQEMYTKGIEMIIKGIDFIKEKLNCKVEAFYIMGNHDTMSSYHATHSLYCWYRNDNNVSISLDGRARKYIEYGTNLIGFTHGDKERDRIYGLMQTEEKEAWGRTTNHEFITGHIHTETVNEKNGIKKRTTSTITGTDAWHYLSGYVGNREGVQAFIYNKYKGLRTIVYGSSS